MLPILASHNDDVRGLLERGYAVSFDQDHLVVRDVPYLDAGGELHWGAIVTVLVFIDGQRVRQHNHQVSFAGGAPHGLDGRPIPNLGDSPHSISLSEAEPRVVVQRQFSNKPANGYVDFLDKIERYIAIISGPAIERHGVTARTFKSYDPAPDDSVFKFRDTLTSRAEIGDLTQAFKQEIVAIIGLGGTGGYVLDFMVKTPVREIRGFDADRYYVHNAYRSPGSLNPAEFDRSKAEVYAKRYENFRDGLHFETKFIDAGSGDDLDGVTFAFVCVDKGSARAVIIDLLIAKGIPFVDVGMGLSRKAGPIKGSMRATYFNETMAVTMRGMDLVPTHDSKDDIYKTNIQIAELNALNASLAVVLYKKRLGFYLGEDNLYNLLLDLGDMRSLGQRHED